MSLHKKASHLKIECNSIVLLLQKPLVCFPFEVLAPIIVTRLCALELLETGACHFIHSRSHLASFAACVAATYSASAVDNLSTAEAEYVESDKLLFPGAPGYHPSVDEKTCGQCNARTQACHLQTCFKHVWRWHACVLALHCPHLCNLLSRGACRHRSAQTP